MFFLDRQSKNANINASVQFGSAGTRRPYFILSRRVPSPRHRSLNSTAMSVKVVSSTNPYKMMSSWWRFFSIFGWKGKASEGTSIMMQTIMIPQFQKETVFRYDYGVGDCLLPEIVITKAHSVLLGDVDWGSFDPLYNNCEHFTTWCKTGKRSSKQADLVVWAAVVAVVIGGLSLIGLYCVKRNCKWSCNWVLLFCYGKLIGQRGNCYACKQMLFSCSGGDTCCQQGRQVLEHLLEFFPGGVIRPVSNGKYFCLPFYLYQLSWSF